MSLGGKPRSLELEEDLGETISGSRDAKSALKSINAVDSSTVSSKPILCSGDPWYRMKIKQASNLRNKHEAVFQSWI